MTTVERQVRRVGNETHSRSFGKVSRTDFVRYAGAGGDFNPMHHDDDFARAAGYPTVFGHGLLTAGLLSSFVADWLGLLHLRRLKVRYVDQVWPGSELVATGRVREFLEVAGEARLVADLTVADRAGSEERIVLRGEVEALRKVGVDGG